MKPFRPHHALAALPALAMLVGVPMVNHVRARPFGLPFLLVWILGCVLLTSAVMAWIERLDRGGDK